jgi:hypothetical protein
MCPGKLDFILETDEQRKKKKKDRDNKLISDTLKRVDEEIRKGLEGHIGDTVEDFRRQYSGDFPTTNAPDVLTNNDIRISDNSGQGRLTMDSESVIIRRPNGSTMSLEQAFRSIERVEGGIQSHIIETRDGRLPTREEDTEHYRRNNAQFNPDRRARMSLTSPAIMEAYRRLQEEGLMNGVPVEPEEHNG